MEELLRALCAVRGTAGREDPAAKTAAALLSRYCETHIDPLGSVVGEKRGPGPHILLDAHLDQIGMAVTAVEEGGFLRVTGVGGMDLRTLAAQEVVVHGKEELCGVIPATPPHLSKAEAQAPDWDALCVDTGLTQEQAQALVPLGSRVTLCAPHTRLLGSRFSGPALDDRSGVAAILRCMELLQGFDCHVTAVFSVQEETHGQAGAKATGFACQPDCALAVDVSFARAPGIDPLRAPGALGGGVMIGIAPGLDYAMGEALQGLARREGIPHTLEVMGGRTGTNADSLQGAGRGIPCALLSIPLRNMHTGVEVVDLRDMEATARLLAAFVRARASGDRNQGGTA
jgi:endoglucanase